MQSRALSLEGISCRGASAGITDKNLKAPYLIIMPWNLHCCCTSFNSIQFIRIYILNKEITNATAQSQNKRRQKKKR